MKKCTVLYDQPPPYGGVRVLAKQTLDELQNLGGIQYHEHLFDSNKSGILGALIKYFKKARQSNVILFQIGDITTLRRKRSLLYWFVSIMAGKPIILRGFAGGMANYYCSLPQCEKYILSCVLSTFKIVTVETKDDFQYFSKLFHGKQSKIVWYPNTRSIVSCEIVSRNQPKRFCFVGKVCRPKGVHHIIDVGDRFPPGVTVDIYGPMEEIDAAEIGLDKISNKSTIRYRGSVQPEKIVNLLKEYDVLLLPTVWGTEGHPGVILEAFSVGLPVIATRWNGIPELVDQTCGILIEPDSGNSLLQAIHTMCNNPDMWQAMRHGAQERLKLFDSKTWAMHLKQWIIMESA